jgi:hypothetical protein
VFLGEVKLALLLEAHAGIALTQGLAGGPVLGQLQRETLLCGNGGGPIGLLVLTAGRRRKGDLAALEGLVEAVELRKDQFAVAVVLGACVLRLRVGAGVGSSATACAGRRRGFGVRPADRCSRTSAGSPRAEA